jgi:DnaJ-class molecular chaperone
MSYILLIAIVAALGYYVSLRLHPTTKCKRCDSSRRHYDLVYSNHRHHCPVCRGTGRHDRLGVRLFLGGTPR